MRGCTTIDKEQGLLNKQRITFIKSGLEIKYAANLFTKTTFAQANPATAVFTSLRISPEPSQSPATTEAEPTLSRLQVMRTERQLSAYLSGVVSRRLLHLVVETAGRFQVLRREKKSSQWQNSLQLPVAVVRLVSLSFLFFK